MADIQEIINALINFRDKRDWKQFHTNKDLAVALSIEAAELNEIFLWKSTEEAETPDLQRLSEELADVFAYAFLLAEKNNLDVKQIILDKIAKNEEKYPVEKSRGNAKKYTELK